jgi:biopolymer transport protein ExbD
MSRFKKNAKKETPEINTGSMSDIIFMFLFFFMVITTIREGEAKVKFKQPTATEYQKLDKKNSYTVYMGEPTDPTAATLNGLYSIQFNNKLAEDLTDKGLRDAVEEFVKESRTDKTDLEAGKITYYLKIDGKTKMDAVNILKNSLREFNALKIQYATNKQVTKKK